MRIAHIAPPWLAIPPKNYGGTENVIYNLVEEQVAQGHAVTLLAPGDAKTSANQISFLSHSLSEDSVPWDAHLKTYYHLHKSVAYLKKHKEDFDIVHTHLSSPSDMYIFPLTETLSIPHVTTLHSQFPFDRTTDGWQGDADHYYMEWVLKAPLVAISASAQRQEQKKGFPLNIIAVIHHGIPVRRAMAESYTNVYKRIMRQRPKLLVPFFSKTETTLPLVAREAHQPLQQKRDLEVTKLS